MDKVKEQIAHAKKIGHSANNWFSEHKIFSITLCCVLVLFLSITGFALYYYHDKAAPGTMIADTAVGGQTRNQIKSTIEKLLNNMRLSLTYNGKSATASASDLGLNIDVNKFADEAVSTGRSLLAGNLFSPKKFKLDGSYDRNKVLGFVTANFPELSADPVDATLAFNQKTETFDVKPGAPGHSIESNKLFAKIDDLMASPKIANYEITISNAAPVVSDAAATEVANQVNRTIHQRINLAAAGKVFAYPDPADIADWAEFTTNPETGSYNVTYNRDKINGYVNDFVAKYLPGKPTSSRAITDASGNVLRSITPGQDGQEMANPGTVAAEIAGAVSGGQGGTVNVETKTTPAKVDGYQAKDNHWVEANLSNYSVTLWDGNNQVYKTNKTSHGKPSTPTITGLFKVVRKVYNKCMPNPPSKEPLCNIHYSTFFEASGYAFHEAWWMSAAKGNMNKGISHGCINMLKEDAKRVYDWSTVGTPVWVHY